ncbi:hypothetical protein ACJMK2_014163 [Sinanodonta woodiana]|uniref:Uncharacterized protein n=1 Tax=Sinanodonta woodiana TaxID=1069815 RepID=A0ABD3V2Q8_SINWO
MGLLLKVILPFKEIYDNRTSSEFQSLATHFSLSLTDIYKNITGFKSIEVLRFRPGSVIVDYVVNFYPTVNIETIAYEIQTKVVSSLKIVAGASVDIDYTSEVMKEKLAAVRDMDLCSLTSADLCPFGYSCKRSRWSSVLCVDRCNSTVCQNNGECYIDHHNSEVQCRCSINNGIAYSGNRCEIKAEVIPAEEKNLYLIISCSIAGGILIIAIIIECRSYAFYTIQWCPRCQ